VPFFLSHRPRKRRRNEEIRGKGGRRDRRKMKRKKKKKKRSCRIFCRKKFHKGTFGAKNTLAGFFSYQKKKLKVCPIELLLAPKEA
jgi:hypothetical protein